ncbi:4-hydroxybenzoate polyprenyltransferase [Thermocatellispora tengchongensis]|uniref:4-hydroxybenzoate polyprenyltransferase n=1 Tax=Thermocatellispora tengchongensis TaxID=1073253 RepID=A0A840PGZ8_9ACTN|nr:UbiA family prenyltransferase [Thermocatellispora tengchongensis]MBB5137203.1 4-hydroxybenzoate polyprenyltransferase [Thermocatellispora tengchongensis]
MTAPRDLLDLVRAPAALSVPGDVIAGAAATGALGRRTAGLACSSVCLYWAGMAANDWADRHLDAVERPERPIPSGRVPAGAALGTAVGLTIAGLAAAWLAGGRRALAIAAPLAASVWTYDVAAKGTRAGPLTMALCRTLDVLLGATPGPSATSGASLMAALPAAVTIGAHTYLLTALSRAEVTGTGPRLPAATLAGTVALAAVTARGGAGPTQPALAAWYAAQFGLCQARAVADPRAGRVRDAVSAGIVSLPALQAALTARGGAPRVALALAAAVPLARRLVRKISAT